MSMQETQQIACPVCKKNIQVEVYRSLNPGRELDAVISILEDKMQTGTCSCGQVIRVEPQFIYMDIKNKLCLAAYPSTSVGNRVALEELANKSFACAFASLPMSESELIFGWVQNEAPHNVTSALSCGKSILDHVRDNPNEWAALRHKVDQGLYIDVTSLFEGH